MLVAAAIGLALSVLGVTIIEYFDDTLKTPDDFTRLTSLPALGAIAQMQGSEYPDKLMALNEPLSPIVEAYRILRTNLQFSSIDRPLRTLILTSPGPAEGKSITLANLAVVLAQSGRKVIVLDADLRRPVQHKIFGLSNRLGLTDALLHAVPAGGLQDKSALHLPGPSQPVEIDPAPLHSGAAVPARQSAPDHVKMLLETFKTQTTLTTHSEPDATGFETVQPVTEFIQQTAVENLRLLSAGPLPPNPAELMGSERMARLLDLLKEEADMILVDSPPMLLVTDAVILGSRVDGTILVIDSGRTRVTEARRAVEDLRKGHINVVGGIVNRMTRQSGGYYYYYYHRYYDSDGNRPQRRKKKNNRFIDRLFQFLTKKSDHRE
jgi:non-specific protein-tyrosine kinase